MTENEDGAGQAAEPLVVAAVADLMFASRIRGAGAAAGVSVALARTADELLELARAATPRLILIDLEARRFDPPGLIRRLAADERTADLTVVAFVSHTNRDAILAAREAGAARVMARSAFVRELPALLTDLG